MRDKILVTVGVLVLIFSILAYSIYSEYAESMIIIKCLQVHSSTLDCASL